MAYEARNVRARGRISEEEALIAEASAVAYGANVTISSGAIGISAPYPYRFRGRAGDVDLRHIPAAIPRASRGKPTDLRL